LRALGVAALLTLVVPHIPFANTFMRPFVWLQTFCHEFGHGFMSLLLSGQWFSLSVFADGSGLMHGSHVAGPTHALVSAAGLVGPAVAAALFFVVTRRPLLARAALLVLGLLMLTCAVMLMDNLFGRLVVGAWGVVFVAAARSLSSSSAQVACAFVGINLGTSVFSRGDYLFMREAMTAEGTLPSDVANVASALGGPWFVWGAVIGVLSVVVVVAGLALLVRQPSRA
jgi:hypothetical protein